VVRATQQREFDGMTIIWTILIGFVAGLIARAIAPGDNKPSGFILTTVLGIVGAFVATWLGQWIGWYGPDDRVTSIVLCHEERGTDSLHFVLVHEDGEEDAVH
jgi:uncharacterized membrane protein YeaQ/YmgE (transglycosylase-associated protein family)